MTPPVASIIARQNWIFDLDGTLTVPVHDFAAIRNALGIPAGRDILGYLSALPEDEARPLHSRLNAIEDGLAEITEPAPGVQALVERLHRRGTRLGVLTRNTRENALRTLELIGVGQFFPEPVVLGRDQALPKPEPDGVRQLARLWGAQPEELVMVGDYRFDLEAGRAAGAATVHVDRTRAFPWPELADLAVGSLVELADLLPAGR